MLIFHFKTFPSLIIPCFRACTMKASGLNTGQTKTIIKAGNFESIPGHPVHANHQTAIFLRLPLRVDVTGARLAQC